MNVTLLHATGLTLLLALANAACAEQNAALSPEEAADGYVLLFNGKNLDGWQGSVNGYAAEDGLLRCKAKGGGDLYTQDEYADFSLRFEFKLTPGANNGIGIRAPRKGNPAFDGMEIQVLDNTAPRYANLKPYQYHGSVYGVVPAKKGHLKPVGEWNQQEIRCQGRQITVILNGETIVDANLDEAATPETLDHRPHPGLKRDTGHIALLGHGHDVYFRNIRVKPLPNE